MGNDVKVLVWLCQHIVGNEFCGEFIQLKEQKAISEILYLRKVSFPLFLSQDFAVVESESA